MKIELLPANDSEILNAGTTRLMPRQPPPISSANTSERLSGSLRCRRSSLLLRLRQVSFLRSHSGLDAGLTSSPDHRSASLQSPFIPWLAFNGLRLLLGGDRPLLPTFQFKMHYSRHRSLVFYIVAALEVEVNRSGWSIIWG